MQINVLELRAGYVVFMGRVSVTISYSSHCLTLETKKYTNENSFIENLASSIYSVGTERLINNNYSFSCSEEELPVMRKCKQVCKLLSAEKEK